MQKQPLLILCICFILGIFFQEFALLPKFWVVSMLAIGLGCAAFFFLKNLFLQKLKPLFLGFLFFTIGVFSHFLNSQNPTLPILNEKEEIVFSIDKKLNSNKKNRRFEITAWKGGEDFKSVISIPKSVPSPDFSHYYKGQVYIHKTDPPKNDYQFDYQKYLSRKKIYFQAYLFDGYSVAAKPELSFTDKIKQKRLEVLNKIDQSTLKQHSKDFLKGLILADRTEMDASVTQDFTRTGLVHFLAISGTHMVVIFISLIFVLKRIFTEKFHKIPIILSLVFIWVFAIFIDYGSSVMRSCLMISIYYGFILLQRKPDLLHSMAVAAFILLIADTQQVFDVGFQLSFIAVFGIFWLNQPILNLLPRPKNRFQRFIHNVFSVTLSAQINTLPLILYYFHQFSLVSILANLIVVPFSETIIVFSLVMVMMLSLNLSLFNTVYDFLVDVLLRVIHFFAEFKVTFFEHIPFTLIEMLLLFVVIFLLRNVLTQKNKMNFLRFGYALLLFFAVKLSLDAYSFNKDEVLVHHLYKDKVFSVKQNGTVFFWVKQKNLPDDLFQKMIVSPYLSAVRFKDYKVLAIPKDAKSVAYQGVRYRLE